MIMGRLHVTQTDRNRNVNIIQGISIKKFLSCLLQQLLPQKEFTTNKSTTSNWNTTTTTKLFMELNNFPIDQEDQEQYIDTDIE